MMSLIALILLPYLAFVFFSESLNPLVKPSANLLRSRWRYGKNMALSVFAGALCATFLMNTTHLAPMSITIGIGVALVLIGYFFFKKTRHNMRR